MEEFDLAKVLAGSTVVTREGQKAEYKGLDLDSACLLNFDVHLDGITYSFTYLLNGKYSRDQVESKYDLFLEESDSELEDTRIGIKDQINPDLLKKRFRDWM
jgi:hypothetical protein